MKPITVPIPEFCRIVGIGRTVAFELIRKGEVTPVKIGRRTVVTVSSIEQLIDRRTVNQDKLPDAS